MHLISANCGTLIGIRFDFNRADHVANTSDGLLA
jgi:hypothetical protein